MSGEIKVARPGVVLRKRVARKPKHCAACGCLIMPRGGAIQKAFNKGAKE